MTHCKERAIRGNPLNDYTGPCTTCGSYDSCPYRVDDDDPRRVRARFVPDNQGGHLNWNGKVWRPESDLDGDEVKE